MLVVQTEYLKIDDALNICSEMENDLYECLDMVMAMDEKYNEPGRYVIFMKPFTKDYPLVGRKTTNTDTTSQHSCDSELDMLGQLYGARSAHELDESYVDVRYKFIKLKRDFEAVLTHCQMIIDCGERQERVCHEMLKNSRSRQKRLCRH
ncbi:uncharacterized protein LOC108035073 [Drosophila biarmipes]|uniref:uncharacterized protein LOC108035073 n=1 Tax=Drosophila biarmipes TaxID=125945 RepID=UPI0007E60EE8|nr:uncharacterized protein LOC108035073 [Drosophila biarmipes]XP_050742699.1 uncharacterized protein LOC108035073 [Drosophila biarmipes]